MKPIDFENALIDSLRQHYLATVKRILVNSPELKSTADIEFKNFTQHIRNKMPRVYDYIKFDNKTEPKILRADTPNFIFEYTILPSKESQFKITLTNSVIRKYDAGFLLSKIKEIDVFGCVYFLKSEFGIKIGCTKNLRKRLDVFNVKLPFQTELHSIVECKDYNNLENLFHNTLAHKRINGEWFNLSPQDFVEIDTILANLQLTRKING